MADNQDNNGTKKQMTVLQKLSLNVKIVILIVVIILVGFFFVYMLKTSLDDVLLRESYDSNGVAPTVTTVFEQGGDSAEEGSQISE